MSVNAQVKAGKLADAEASYRQAIRLKTDFAVAVADLGLVLNEQGKLKEARKQCSAGPRP